MAIISARTPGPSKTKCSQTQMGLLSTVGLFSFNSFLRSAHNSRPPRSCSRACKYLEMPQVQQDAQVSSGNRSTAFCWSWEQDLVLNTFSSASLSGAATFSIKCMFLTSEFGSESYLGCWSVIELCSMLKADSYTNVFCS